jgi:hypothetical protein
MNKKENSKTKKKKKNKFQSYFLCNHIFCLLKNFMLDLKVLPSISRIALVSRCWQQVADG